MYWAKWLVQRVDRHKWTSWGEVSEGEGVYIVFGKVNMRKQGNAGKGRMGQGELRKGRRGVVDPDRLQMCMTKVVWE